MTPNPSNPIAEQAVKTFSPLSHSSQEGGKACRTKPTFAVGISAQYLCDLDAVELLGGCFFDSIGAVIRARVRTAPSA